MKRDISGVDDSSSDEGSGSGSEESSSGSESEVELLSKPIFLKKKKSVIEDNVVSEVLDEDNGKADERILKNLNNIKDIEDKDLHEFDGVDDYDDNEEEEYSKWRIREYERYQRDKKIAIELEIFKQEQMNRSNMTEDELIQQFEARKDNNQYHKGPFQNDELEEFEQKISQRDYSQKEIDHSRPTRFKQS